MISEKAFTCLSVMAEADFFQSFQIGKILCFQDFLLRIFIRLAIKTFIQICRIN